MNNDQEVPSRATRVRYPDLDWTQVHETMLMLELAAGQIEAAMTESSSSVDVLTETFTTMAGYLRTLSGNLAQLPDNGEIGQMKASLTGAAEHANATAQQAIIAFQFYDKLSQRLAHVCHSLAELSALVADRDRALTRDEWVHLQETIRSKYTSAEERDMFEAVLAGIPVPEVLRKFVSTLKDKGDDIEFF